MARTETNCDLADQRCKPCEGGVAPLNDTRVQELLAAIPGWRRDGVEIVREYTFKNFYETMAFVNAVAFISNRENHHPDMKVSYKTCGVRYHTHAIGGLSENDFICAAKVNALLAA